MDVCLLDGRLQSATCDEETPSAKRRDKRRGRHAYEAVTVVRSFVQIGEGSYTQVCAITAVAIFCCRC